MEKANRRREEKKALELGSSKKKALELGSPKTKALESGGSKQCKGCKKKKPTKEFLSLRRPNTVIQTC